MTMDPVQHRAKKPYRQLVAWHAAHAYALQMYAMTESFPTHERYALTSQLRRAAVSVPTNMVEGYAKHSPKELLRYLDIAAGSLTETEYLLELARDLGYFNQAEYDQIEETRSKAAFLLWKFTLSKQQPTTAPPANPNAPNAPYDPHAPPT